MIYGLTGAIRSFALVLPAEDNQEKAIVYIVVLLDAEACLFMLMRRHAHSYYIKGQPSLQRLEAYDKLKARGRLIAAYGRRTGFSILVLNESTHSLELSRDKYSSSSSIFVEDLLWLSDSELCLLDIIGNLHIVRLHGKFCLSS